MNNILFEKEYSVNSVNINFNQQLGLFGLLGMIQDISAIHADILGIGLQQMREQNAFWVLTQQKLKMNKWPKWQDVVRIKTWPRGTDGLKIYRDFEIFVNNEKIGESVITYMILDGQSRRPLTVNMQEKYNIECPKEVLGFVPEKILVPDDALEENATKVRISDLDMNYHVNNTKYAQWILDSISLEIHRSTTLLEFDINFLGETYLNDEISIGVLTEDPVSPVSSLFRGVRKQDGRVVFTARIKGLKKAL